MQSFLKVLNIDASHDVKAQPMFQKLQTAFSAPVRQTQSARSRIWLCQCFNIHNAILKTADAGIASFQTLLLVLALLFVPSSPARSQCTYPPCHHNSLIAVLALSKCNVPQQSFWGTGTWPCLSFIADISDFPSHGVLTSWQYSFHYVFGRNI